MLLFIAIIGELPVTNLFLSFQIARLIRFSLAGSNSFLSGYRFISVVVLLQELTVFFLQMTVFCWVYGFSMMSQLHVFYKKLVYTKLVTSTKMAKILKNSSIMSEKY